MKETIEYLKKDRKVNDTFMKKLQKVGFEIDYTRYGYWDNVECVRIGRAAYPYMKHTFLIMEIQSHWITDIRMT